MILIPYNSKNYLAYAAPGDIDDNVIEDTSYASPAQNPDIINISGDIFAIVYRGSSVGAVSTITIDSTGNVGSIIETFNFESTTNTSGQKIIHVTGNIYAIGYQQSSTNSFLVRTVTIDSSGDIGSSTIDSITVEASSAQATRTDLISIANNMIAVVYPDSTTNDGFVSTIQINSDGTIEDSLVDTLEYDESLGLQPSIINVSGNVFAIAYQDTGLDATVKTITITSSGAISDSFIDALVFDDIGTRFTMVKVSDGVFAVTNLSGSTVTDIDVTTFGIDSAGNIDNSIIEQQTFVTGLSSQADPDFISVSGDVFAIVYEDSEDDGFVITFDITSSGDIASSVTDSLEFNTSTGRDPTIINVSGAIFAIPYRTLTQGFIATISIELPPTPVTTTEKIGGRPKGDISAPSFSLNKFAFSRSFPESVLDTIQDDPLEPIEPIKDQTLALPLVINDNGYAISKYTNTIQTNTIETGEPVNIQLNLSDETGLEYVALYTNLRDDKRKLKDSDTWIIFEEYEELQIQDPNGFFSFVNVTFYENKTKYSVSFNVTFAKPMEKSDILFRMWDERRNSADTKIFDALEVVGEEIEDKVTLSLVKEAGKLEPFVEDEEKKVVLDKWAGYYAESVVDSEVLKALGMEGNHIPHWVKKFFGENIHQEQLKIKDLKIALEYLMQIDIVK